MTDKIGSGTAQGLIEFLDQLVEKGRANSGGIVPLKSTLRQVLSKVDGEENWGNTDIRNINTEDYIARFKNLTVGKYMAESYVVYLSRLNKVKEWYTTFLLNPGWVPPISNKIVSKNNSKQKDNKTKGNDNLKINKEEKEIGSNSGKQSISDNNSNDLITYPFPLRVGKMAYLYLPIDLTLIEAKRLGKYLESLSIDDFVQ